MVTVTQNLNKKQVKVQINISSCIYLNIKYINVKIWYTIDPYYVIKTLVVTKLCLSL